MRRQRFPFTVSAQSEETLLQETDDDVSLFSSHYSIQDPMWSQVFSAETEPLVPCYLYQYPVLQIPSEPCQSVTSVLTGTTLPVASFDGYSYYSEPLMEPQEYNATSPPISDSGYGDGLVQDVYPCEELPYNNNFQEIPPEIPNTYPMVTNYGAVTVLLRHLVRVDISPDKSVYVTNSPSECVAVANGMGDQSCVVHPNGRVFHDGDEIHMSTLNRKAKMSRRGVVFTSSDHCLSYLVDASGTKTTAEKFRDLNQDFSYQVFYSDMSTGSSIDQCYKMVDEAVHRTYKNGDEVWILGGLRIKQDQWGDVKVSRNYGRRVIRASPTNGQVYVKTDSVEITVGRYPNNYFVVRRAGQAVTASLRGFTAQSGTQKAGFNNTGKLVLK